jgi:Family of unknown function (DUF6174)
VVGDWTPQSDSTPPPRPPRQRNGALTAAERDSIVREAQARRATWRARGISDYRLLVVVACFCPGPLGPGVIDVQGGVVVALRDTTGRSMQGMRGGRGPFEPWSSYTIEGLFDAVERGAQSSDVLEVSYDASFGYPARIRGDMKLGLPDDWFIVTASGLAPRR